MREQPAATRKNESRADFKDLSRPRGDWPSGCDVVVVAGDQPQILHLRSRQQIRLRHVQRGDLLQTRCILAKLPYIAAERPVSLRFLSSLPQM